MRVLTLPCQQDALQLSISSKMKLSDSDLMANGVVLSTFKSGSWDTDDNYRAEKVLNNVSIKYFFKQNLIECVLYKLNFA